MRKSGWTEAQILRSAQDDKRRVGFTLSAVKGRHLTSTGIVFSAAKDGKSYAFDAATGSVLWAGILPTGTEGLPSMYSANGHEDIVNATTPLTW